MIAVCPKGHLHSVRKDAAGFPVYGFLVYFTGPCKYNGFRIPKQKGTDSPAKATSAPVPASPSERFGDALG